MLSSIEMPLREAMARQGVPPELLPKMKVADFGRILFNEYGKEPYHPGRGNILALEDVVPGLDSRHKAFFWKYNMQRIFFYRKHEQKFFFKRIK